MAALAPYSHRTHLSTERPGVKAAARRAEVQGWVDAWNAANPEIATPFGRENLARSGVMPSVQVLRQHGEAAFGQMWVDRFAADPDLMWLMIGDIVRYVSSEETERGTRMSGRRRVRPEDHNLAKVWEVIAPQVSMDPFPVAVRELIGTRSMSWFSQRAGFKGRSTLVRYMSGQRPLTGPVLIACAKAGRVEPFYFLEFRAIWVATELFRAMLSRPGESWRAVKTIRDAVV